MALSDEMTSDNKLQLTDEMISNALHSENMEGCVVLILFAIAAVGIFLTGIIYMVIQKKKKKLKLTAAELICTGAAFLVICGFIAAMLYSNRQNAARDEAWQITTDTVSDLYSRRGHSKNSRIYYAYTAEHEQEIAVSQTEYDLLETGDEVYIIIDSEGEAAGLWRAERYTYVGERLLPENNP